MTREELLEIIKSKGIFSLEECMDYYQVYGLKSLSDKQLQEWIKIKEKKNDRR